VLEARIHELGLQGIVRLAGFVPQMAPLFATADIVVLSSVYEGQPNALLEALQHDCKVTAAGGEGVREVLASLGLAACWIGETDFVAGFSASLARTLAIPEDRWKKARTELARQTDMAAVAAAYFRICQECR